MKRPSSGLYSALFVGLLAILASSANAQSPVAHWECPQNVAAPLGISRDLPIRISDQGYEIVGLDDLFAQARQVGEINYGACLSALINGARSTVTQAYCTDRNQFGGCVTRTAAWHVPFANKVADYIADADRNGAVDPFEPAAVSATPMDSSAIASVGAQISGVCAGGAWIKSGQALDRIFMTTELPRLVSASGCPAKIAQNYARMIAAAMVSSRVCGDHQTLCASRREAGQAAFDLLTSAGLGRYLVSGGSSPALDLVDLFAIESSAHPSGCMAATAAGVDVIENHATAVAPAAYRLIRLADRVLQRDYRGLDGKVTHAGTRAAAYKAVINLRIDDSGSPGSADKIRASTKRCYAEMHDRLRGSDGEFLDVQLYEGPQGPGAPPVSDIVVGMDAKTVRADTGHWLTGIPCETILHESMHLLGLPDEYPETSIGRSRDANGSMIGVSQSAQFTDYDCRSIGPILSIMYRSYDAYHSVIDSSDVTVELCHCASGSCGITAATRSCPSGGRTKHLSMNDWKFTEVPGFKNGGDMLGPGQRYNSSEVVLSLTYSDPVHQSLIYGGQFNAITHPGCTDAARLYSACAREWRRTSPSHYGSDRCGVAVPSECYAPGGAWVN